LTTAVRDASAMLAGMEPRQNPGRFRYQSLPTGAPIPADAVGWFHEAEGPSVIVPARAGDDLPLAWITLTVHSALDGVGLTAAVSGALAGAGIACNMVAAHHHDHLFVPEADAERAMHILRALQLRAFQLRAFQLRALQPR
jgi:uncharacterized protein